MDRDEGGGVKETELAAAVVAYLRDLGWDVHQEVGFAYGPRADIVAVRGPVLLVVEAKTTFGLSVIAQADHWLGHANLVSVAVPRSWRNGGTQGVAANICREWGIGVLEVLGGAGHNDQGQFADGAYVAADWRVEELVVPRLQRRTTGSGITLRAKLCAETRTYAEAGNNEGKFWSPFKATVAEIHRVLKERPGLTTRELVGAIKHHYASASTARSCLPRWLSYKKIPGVRGEGERPMRWYLGEAA